MGSVPTDSTGTVTGYRGGMRTGLALNIPSGSREEDWRWDVDSVRAGAEAEISLSVQFLEPNCENFPSDLACPDLDEAVVSYRLSALLDFEPLALGDSAQPGEATTLDFEGRSSPHAVATTAVLPALDAGEHCLLVAVFEDDSVVVGGQFADHSNAAVFTLDAGGSSLTRCHAPPFESAWWPTDPEGPVGDCAWPLLTTRPQVYSQAVPPSPEGLWAVLPRCGGSQSTPLVAFAVDGVLQAKDAVLAPVSVPQLDEGSVVIHLGAPDGWIRVMIIDRLTTEFPAVRYSRPARYSVAGG